MEPARKVESRPKKVWRLSVVEETKTAGTKLGAVKMTTQNLLRWRAVTAAL